MDLSTCRLEDVIEVEDEATDEQIAHEVREWAFEHFDYWHEEVTDESEDTL